MKKRYVFIGLSIIYITFLVIVKLPSALDGAVDKAIEMNKDFAHSYNTCDISLNKKDYKEASDCFGKLLKKYNRSDVRYNYAVALAQSTEYEKAKKELEYIIDNEQNAPQIVESAKNLDKQIDDILKQLRIDTKTLSDIEKNNIDAGDYFADLQDYTLWQNPKNITVYIKDEYKKDLFKQAFTHWNAALDGVAFFNFMDSPAKANIICSFADITESDEGGVTDWYAYEIGKKKYFKNLNITIAKYAPNTGKQYNDDQLYSIMLHEIGHALGISDHSPFKGDMMYFSTDGFLNGKGKVSNRDINTVKKLYKQK